MKGSAAGLTSSGPALCHAVTRAAEGYAIEHANVLSISSVLWSLARWAAGNAM